MTQEPAVGTRTHFARSFTKFVIENCGGNGLSEQEIEKRFLIPYNAAVDAELHKKPKRVRKVVRKHTRNK